MQHETYMRRCLELAKIALMAGNIAVGAIIVRDDVIIAEASEELPNGLDVTAHAEILAVKGACIALESKDLSDCTLYTTAEPCWMCSYTIRDTRIKRVVYGTKTMDVGGLSTEYPLLSASNDVWDNPPEIIAGVLADECVAIRRKS